MLILVKLQAEACNFKKINTSPWVFFTFFKLYKKYQIAQRITYWSSHFASAAFLSWNSIEIHWFLRSLLFYEKFFCNNHLLICFSEVFTVNTFHATGLPSENMENLWFSVFRGYRKTPVTEMSYVTPTHLTQVTQRMLSNPRHRNIFHTARCS